MANLAVILLSTMRMAVGSVAFVAPSTTAKLAGHPSSALPNRIWGARDAVLGGLLFAASTEETTRAALYAGLATDTLDIAAVAFGLLDGSVGARTAVILGGGAVTFVGLGLVGLKALDGKKANAREQASLLRGGAK